MADLTTHRIEFPSNGHQTPGYLARPTYKGPHRGVVLIQEWWGLVPHIEELARRFARHGFVALAPDLYYGKTAEEPDEARKLAMALDRERAIAEIAAAARYLKAMDQISPKWVGVVGWCMGGGLAVSSAAYSGDIAAVVCFYGMPLDNDDIARIQAPVLGLYGGQDAGIPPERVNMLDEALTRFYVPHEMHIYPNSGHAFFNSTRPDHYDEIASKDAWRRTIDWLRQHLG